jgi:nitrogenase iron protein
LEIAVYGKGGIGKSTVGANLSAALSGLGLRVLQIGCDPKHDSTRLLLGGLTPVTAMDYMRVTKPPDYRIEDILAVGYGGVGCVEAGGPKPGVGCAGRGILSTFELLGQFKLKEHYDATLYDVLGDVVCGGFAVPIRREYADTILIVTSGEFMALYAANNILRGIRNYDGEAKRVAGLVLNRRDVDDETGRALRFARAVALPIIAELPRSEIFTRAESARMTLAEYDGDCAQARIFRALADDIARGIRKHEARPLTDEALERVVLGAGASDGAGANTIRRPVARTRTPDARPKDTKSNATDAPISHEPAPLANPNRYLSKNVVRGEPLHGCAFNGALTMCAQIKDATVLAHAPKSCAYISYQTMSSTGRRHLFERGALMPSSIAPNIEGTDMDEADMIFGGAEKLADKIAALKKRRPKAIIAVSACPAGIIGDDIDDARVLGDAETPVFTLRADGNMAGDFLQGMLLCYTELARQMIRRGAEPVDNTVNIVFEKVIAKNTPDNFRVIEDFLNRMGVRVNCRFLCETDCASIANFCAARLNLLAHRDYTGNLLAAFFEREYGSEFFGPAFPVGFAETEDWLRGVAAFFGKRAVAEKLIEAGRARYLREIEALRPVMRGKRLMIVTYNHELDWILGAALDAGLSVVKIGVLDYSQDEGFRTRLDVPLNVEEHYDPDKRARDIACYKPDILLTNYTSASADETFLADTIPMCPDVGFFTGADTIKRWAGLLALNPKGEWENDERLFRKYYS